MPEATKAQRIIRAKQTIKMSAAPLKALRSFCAHLYAKPGEHDRALEHHQAAAEKTTNIPERNYLITKATRLSLGRGSSE